MWWLNNIWREIRLAFTKPERSVHADDDGGKWLITTKAIYGEVCPISQVKLER
jgi:hypothetical protein